MPIVNIRKVKFYSHTALITGVLTFMFLHFEMYLGHLKINVGAYIFMSVFLCILFGLLAMVYGSIIEEISDLFHKRVYFLLALNCVTTAMCVMMVLGTNLMRLTQIGLIPPEEQVTFYSLGLLVVMFIFVNLALFHCKIGKMIRGKNESTSTETKQKEVNGN